MTLNITRNEMVHWMESDGHARIVERPRLSWARLDTYVCDQGSGAFQARLDQFHLFEVVLAGGWDQDIDTNLESLTQASRRSTAGDLQYQSAANEAACAMDGFGTIQQVLIDDSFFRDAWAAVYPGDPDNSDLLSFYGAHDDAMMSNAMDLLDEACAPTAGGELYAEMLAQQIALQIVRRQNARAQKTHRPLKLSEQEVYRVVGHMQAALDNPGGLEALARLIDMDTLSFCRAFEATMGVAPHEYLADMRMVAIKEHLTHSHCTIAEIASRTGFASQSQMASTFRERMGMSPTKFRKIVRA